MQHGEVYIYQIGCLCEKCRPYAPRPHEHKADRIERVAAEMRQRNRRIAKIRATVIERRGHSAHYPRQDVPGCIGEATVIGDQA